MGAPIRVLVVDDSAFMRKALCAMLEGDPRVAVAGVARNGEEAVQKVAELDPDVVTLDVEMPGMNGLEALRRLMAVRPLPVIMVSSLTVEGASETLQALDLGAVDYIPKQLDGLATNITTIRQELLGKVIAAAGAAGKIHARPAARGGTREGADGETGRGGEGGNSASPCPRVPGSPAPIASRLSSGTVAATRGSKVVAIGCSTGGPQALMDLLPLLPADFPAGIVIVQHMPKFFTKPFAERTNQACRIEVREAAEGDAVTPGVALIAPGGLQCRLVRRRATSVEIALSPNTEGLLHAPSVDVMLKSVAEVYGERGVGVILTGMGQDGLEGARALRGAKGRLIAQDEASCVVYGMPKAVVDAGIADKVVPLPLIAGEIINMV